MTLWQKHGHADDSDIVADISHEMGFLSLMDAMDGHLSAMPEQRYSTLDRLNTTEQSTSAKCFQLIA